MSRKILIVICYAPRFMNILRETKVKCKYSSTQNNFEYVAINLFNSIPMYYRNMDDTEKFKIKIVLLKNPLYNVSEFYDLKWT